MSAALKRICGSFHHIRNNFRNLGSLLYEPPLYHRSFHFSALLRLKEIQIKEENNITTVEGVFVKSDSTKPVLPEHPEGLCPTCPTKLGVDIKYTDILIISQFVRSDGCLLPRRITGLCPKAHNRMRILVHQAQRAGLMPEMRPALDKKHNNQGLMSNYKFKKYKVYFDNLTPMTLTHSARSIARTKKVAEKH